MLEAEILLNVSLIDSSVKSYVNLDLGGVQRVCVFLSVIATHRTVQNCVNAKTCLPRLPTPGGVIKHSSKALAINSQTNTQRINHTRVIRIPLIP